MQKPVCFPGFTKSLKLEQYAIGIFIRINYIFRMHNFFFHQNKERGVLFSTLMLVLF